MGGVSFENVNWGGSVFLGAPRLMPCFLLQCHDDSSNTVAMTAVNGIDAQSASDAAGLAKPSADIISLHPRTLRKAPCQPHFLDEETKAERNLSNVAELAC